MARVLARSPAHSISGLFSCQMRRRCPRRIRRLPISSPLDTHSNLKLLPPNHRGTESTVRTIEYAGAGFDWTNVNTRLDPPPRREPEAINQTNRQQQHTPPNISMQVEQHHARTRRRIHQLVNASSQDQCAIYRQRNTNKKPD